MKRILLVALLVVGLGLTAFAADKVTVRFWRAPTDEKQMALLDYFQEQNPDINLVIEWIPPANIREKVLLAIAAGDPPDVLYDYPGRTMALAAQGFLEPLEDTLTAEDYDDFIPGVIGLNSLDGHFYGYPFGCSYRAIEVNMDLCEEAGVAHLLPTGPGRNWTFEAFMKVADGIKSLGVYPFAFFAKATSGDYYMLTYFQMFGASLYEGGDYTKTTLNSEAGVRALQWMIDMVGQGYAPKGVAGLSADDFISMKVRAQVGIGGWCWTKEQLQLNVDNGIIDYIPNWYFVSLPHVEGIPGPPAYMAWNQTVVFKGQSPETLAASKRLARWLGSTEPYELLSHAHAMPTRKSASVDHLQEFGRLQVEWVSINGVADLGYCSPFYLEVRDLQHVALQEAFMGLKTPKKALDDFAEAVAKLWED